MSREKFEAWVSDNGKFQRALERKGDIYLLATINTQWEAWQAASKASEQHLEESRREFRAADATIHNLEQQLAAVVAENAGLFYEGRIMSVTRYGINSQGSFTNNSDGAYVSFNDYSALEQKLTDLAVQLANAESKCRELAAENAGLKDSVEHAAGCIHAAEVEGLIDALGEKDGERLADLVHRRLCHAYLPVEAPATDAFLAEVRAQGVERVGEYLRQYAQGLHEEARLVLQDAGELCNGFAAQLRKGAAL